MDTEVQLISDGDGLAVVGEPAAVESFLVFEGLAADAVELPQLGSVLRAGSIVAQVGSEIEANSGRWFKVTEESARRIKKFGLTESGTPGVSHAMVGRSGSIRSWVQFTKRPGSLLSNPALLAGAAGVMAQLAMQQSMNEITDYLATIDRKVDGVLRSQKDAVIARMVGAGLIIEEAMRTREHAGRVNEVTWSKVQAVPATIAETQAYALRQLDALAEGVERETSIGDLAEAAEEAKSRAQEWLAVLARSFQLQDAIAVIELDRVLDAAPGQLDAHRLGLKAARKDRLELIARSTEQLLARMDAAASRANTKVLLHPTRSRDVVEAGNQVGLAVDDFRARLGIESAGPSFAARSWADAAAEVRSKVLETGADGVDVAKRLGNGTVDRAKAVRTNLYGRIPERPRWRRRNEPDADN